MPPSDEATLRVLSLGAGVQSSTVLLMSCLGELPPVDCAVFADTGWEPSPVYSHFSWLQKKAASYGIEVFRVSHGNIRLEAEGDSTTMPLHVRSAEKGGKHGMMQRRCTKDYKIAPIETFVRRKLLGMRKWENARGRLVEFWFGISSDEEQRVRESREAWKTYYYPLIERGFTRQDCLDWCEEQGFPEPPRSACLGCPFRSNAEWKWLKENDPVGWREAVSFDRALRHQAFGELGRRLYVHRECLPLNKVNLDRRKWSRDRGLDDECLGMCGI